MTPLNVQNVIELLRAEIDRVGGQSEWARQTGIERVLINRVLNGHRLPPSTLCRALGLEWVLVHNGAQCDGETKSVIVGNRDFLRILRKEIRKAGSVIVWSRRVGVDRTYLSNVLHGRKSPSKKILAALNLSEVLVCTNNVAIKDLWLHNLWLRNKAPGKKQPHARW
jgi:hypothetical protein